MNNKELEQYRSPEYLAAYFMNGHRQWVDGRLYEMFKKPKADGGMICCRCEFLGLCPTKIRKICVKMAPDQYFEYGLRRVI